MILDTSGKLLEQGIKAVPTMIKPNLDEIRMLTGKDCTDPEEIIEAAKVLRWAGDRDRYRIPGRRRRRCGIG